MKKILIFTTLIFAFHARANDACANKALDALERGGANASRNSTPGNHIEKGATDPVTGKDLNNFQVELANGAKARVETAFGRSLSPDDALVARGYSDAFNRGDKALMAKYEEAMKARGFSADEIKVLQSRITDPSYNGNIPTVESIRLEGQAKAAAEAKAKAAAEEKARADAKAREQAEQQRLADNEAARRRNSSNPFERDPSRTPASLSVKTDEVSLYAYSGQGRSSNQEAYRRGIFIGATKYIDETLNDLKQAQAALSRTPAGSMDHATLSRTVSSLKARCQQLISMFNRLNFGPESRAQVADRVSAVCP